MNTANGFGKDIAWKQGSKQHAAAPEPPGATAPAASAAASTPIPIGTGSFSATATSIALRIILGVLLAVIGLLGLLFLLLRSTSTHQPAAQTTPVPAAPAPASAANKGETYREMVQLLSNDNQWAAAARMAEKALQTEQLSSHERTALHERALTAKLHVLLSEPISPLNITAQQQVVTRYRYLQQQAADLAIPFVSNLEGAKQAKDAGKLLLSKLLFEEAFTAGEYSRADHDTLRLYADLLYRIGWYYGQGSDVIKAEGLQLLAASYALEQEQGITHGVAWAELRKYCGPDETTWPKPAATPLLDQ